MFRECNDWFVIIGIWGIVWTPREGVSSVRGARLVDELDIILLSFSNVSSNAGSNFVGVSVELEVRVVSDNEDWVDCAFKQVIPVFKSPYNSEEFPIINRVTLFRCGKCLRVVTAGSKNRVPSSILEFLVRLK
jgi:hypothetical protein